MPSRLSPHPSRLRRLSAFACIAICLAGCGISSAAERPTATPIPFPTATPTPGTTFVVAVTQIPTPRPPRRVRHKRSRPARIPTGPYIRLFPSSGPPQSRLITVRGGHLPGRVGLEITWSSSTRFTPIQITGYTDPHGGLTATLRIPGSPPGIYRVTASFNGIVEAAATYRVQSRALLQASTFLARNGRTIAIAGRSFVPRLNLALVAYPLLGNQKPVLLARVTTNGRGSFNYQGPLRSLPTGEYDLRAYSTSALSAQMAETFFELVS